MDDKAEVALIVGGGPGISASCARLFSHQGLKVAVAARDAHKPALQALARDPGVTVISCDALIRRRLPRCSKRYRALWVRLDW